MFYFFSLRPRHRERHDEKVSNDAAVCDSDKPPLCSGSSVCSPGNYKLLLTPSVLIYSDIHWSQPGEKRMTGGTNWQPKAAPTTTWNPVSMVTHILWTVVLMIPAGLQSHFSSKYNLLFAFEVICIVCVPSATVNHGLPCHHTDRHDGIWHGQYNDRYAVCFSQAVSKNSLYSKGLDVVDGSPGGEFY